MKHLPICALLIGTGLALVGHLQNAIAQQPQQPSSIDQAFKGQLGELLFNNTIMTAELKRLTEENTKLKVELEALKKEKGDAK